MIFQAVIFDMDGLLMDSELVGLTVMQQCGALQGYDISLDQVRHTLGATTQASSDYYHTFFPDLDADRLFLDFKNAMCGLARQGKIPLKPGARELLAALRQRGIPRAVASSSGLAIIRTYLESAGILEDFDALITAVGLPSKTAPDVFLKAAEALGAKPEGCLVLEDSINGVQAGRAAGMTVCMVPDLIPFTDQLAPYCDHVLEDLSQVVPLLAP
ncbi:MAG: HAD family phosphatase [Clostridiales bacterium]|nr:HAD family phosphatase [Clostridiales bacterium]